MKWDPTAGAILRPERVCPWNIDAMELTNKKKPFILHQQKRPRTDDASSPGFSSLLMNGGLSIFLSRFNIYSLRRFL